MAPLPTGAQQHWPMVGDIGQPLQFYYYMCFMFIYLPVCAILTVLIVYIDVTGYSMYAFFFYYILCIFNISPQSVVNFRSIQSCGLPFHTVHYDTGHRHNFRLNIHNRLQGVPCHKEFHTKRNPCTVLH